MSSTTIDRLLAALIVALAATGAASLTAGAPDQAWIFIAHDLLAGLLFGAVLAKLRVSLPRAVRGRRWGRLALAALVTVAVLGSLAAGFVWVAGGTISWWDVGPMRWTLLTIHAALGIALVPLLAAHLIPRRWRVLRPRAGGARSAQRRIPRRAFLLGGGFAAVAVGLVGMAAGLERLGGGVRRFTGSRFLPAGPPGIPTTFLGEPEPQIDRAAWRLRVVGRVEHPLELDLDDLAAFGPIQTTAVLDCTAGWAIEATWSGALLAAVLHAAGAAADLTRLDFVSVTGWRATLPAREASSCLLAWAEGGTALTSAHGAPLRLVAPGHRGLEWVKWLERIEVT